MPSASHDLTHLASMIEAAREEARRLGVDGEIARLLENALLAARAASSRDGRADEGRRPQDLSSANDG